MKIENVNKSCSVPKQNHIRFSEVFTKKKKFKTPNKQENMVKHFMHNLFFIYFSY